VINPRFLPAAELELLKEVAYYSKARKGVGVRFQAAVAVAVTKAAANPSAGRPSAASTRSRIVKGFPFDVVYRHSEAGVLVVAVAPHRRQPGYWSGRIE
jgi:toxin ParE1/3/4